MKLVVGLGNVGQRYSHTRHNLGFIIVDELAKRHGAKFSEDVSHRADLAEVELEGGKVWLVKPRTMMNDSGLAVRSLAHYYKIEPDDVIVVSDDFNVDFGQLRVRHGGESGGHNGLGSIIDAIGPHFWRFRIGVRSGHMDKSEHSQFVTGTFAPEEQRQLKRIIDRGTELLEEYLAKGELAHNTVRLV